jgi:hypothetical protein
MAAGGNSSGNKSLNDKKERAAGRMKDGGAEREEIKDFQGQSGRPVRGAAAGASGKSSKADRSR